MLLRKHQYIALFSSSLSLLALVNCSDSDVTTGAEAGTSNGEAGAMESAGATSKAGAASHAGATSHAGAPSAMGGDTSEGGSAGKRTTGSSGAPTSVAGSDNSGDSGAAGMGMDEEGGAAGQGGGAGSGAGAGTAGGPTGPHVGAILKYTFDAGVGAVAVDVSGNGLNGTLALDTGWTTQGRNGAGLALTGGVLPTTYVTVPPGVFKDVKNTTIAAWVKLNLDLGWNRIFDFGGSGAGPDARFMYLTTNTPDGVRFDTFGGDATTRESLVTTKTLLPLGVWKHIAVTASEGGKHAIYIDGFPAAEATTVDIPPSELEPMSASSWIGKSRFNQDPGLNGALDDFQVYDRVLTPAEIATLAYPQGDYTRIPFDEASGTSSADTSSRAVNATLNGGATWASGRLGAAVVLSGDNQYVTLANPLAGCTDSATIAMWVKQVATAPWVRLFDFGGTSDNFMFLTANNNVGPNATGNLQMNIHTSLIETMVISTTPLPADSTWHHVAAVVSPLAASLYLDGTVIANAPTPVTPAVLGATNEQWLGKSRFPDPYFNGAIDEVRIACRAYTSDEIKSLAFH